MKRVEVIIIGAGAAGLMCAIEAGKRNRNILVLDHANKVGKKILMSGGGRCNFTNNNIHPTNFISHNPHFCKSALSRYTQWDFVALVQHYKIAFHEKKLGQLFCDNKANDIVAMLLAECAKAAVDIRLNTSILTIEQRGDHEFLITTNTGDFICQSLVIATGGLSIPTMGASHFGYKIAEQFGIKVWPTRAGLVPFTLMPEDKARLAPLSGIAVDSTVSTAHTPQTFRENMLFTHRGLSGPAMLQISSYWQPGENIVITMLPEINLLAELKTAQQTSPQQLLKSVLMTYLAKRVVTTFLDATIAERPLQACTHKQLQQVAAQFQQWVIKPSGTEGYRTAEVTLGGVDCDAISSKTMAVNAIPGLYFIGEVLDVTGWLGGYNFQWAWSSGWAAGQMA